MQDEDGFNILHEAAALAMQILANFLSRLQVLISMNDLNWVNPYKVFL
jgi:hypothetical protein